MCHCLYRAGAYVGLPSLFSRLSPVRGSVPEFGIPSCICLSIIVLFMITGGACRPESEHPSYLAGRVMGSRNQCHRCGADTRWVFVDCATWPVDDALAFRVGGTPLKPNGGTEIGVGICRVGRKRRNFEGEGIALGDGQPFPEADRSRGTLAVRYRGLP